jgi:cytochrome c-type biogenesis protein CcmH/NrfG
MSVKRAAPISAIAFVVFFIASVAVSSVPSATASDADWVAAYASHGKQVGHFATGILLVLAALSLATFLTDLWTRVVAARQPRAVSPLPVVAAGISAACIAAGGVLMASISASALIGSAPIPSAELLRFGNDVGFGLVGVAGMLAASLSIACLSLQARSAGVFGKRLTRFSLVVAVLLLGSVAFVPILALLIWLIVVSVALRSSSSARGPANGGRVEANRPVEIRA